MKAEFITAYFMLRQIPLARMTADGNKRSESQLRLAYNKNNQQ